MAKLDTTFGAMLLGVLFTAVGYGVTNVQTYFYATNYPKDARIYKCMVASLWCLDSLHVALSWHMIYYYLVNNFDNNAALEDSIWSFNVTVPLTCAITAIVHIFYIKRVWLLSGHSKLLVGFIAMMSICRVVFGIVVTVYLFPLKKFDNFRAIDPFVGTGLSAGALADATITASMCYFLHRTRTGFERTNNMIDKLMIYTVNSGLFTTIFGVLVVICFVTLPHSLLFLAVHLMLSKLYSNAALASLNTRISLRGKGISEEETTVQMSSASRSRGQTTGLRSNASKKVPPVVHVMTTTTTDLNELEMVPASSDSTKYSRPMEEGSMYELKNDDYPERPFSELDTSFGKAT